MVSAVIILRPYFAVSVFGKGIIDDASGSYIFTPVGTFAGIQAKLLVCFLVFIAHLNSRSVYSNRLDGGSRLTRIDSSVVKLFACRSAAAHHAFDFTGLVLDDNCGSLRLADLLLECVVVI